MEEVSLGRHGLKVSRLGLGCMAMSGWYGGADEAGAIATIHRALDLGITYLDTGDFYVGGHNEELVGRALRGRRHRVIVATKTGVIIDPRTHAIGRNASPAYIRSACEASLRRLAIDALDVYVLARVDPETPVEETVGAMGRLTEEGKVRHLGLSEVSASTLRKAVAVHPISILQTEYSIWSRDPEREILAACRDLGVGFVAYSPLGRGFLTGAVSAPDALAPDDLRRRFPRFQPQNFARNREILHALEAIAREREATPAQLCLAWLLAKVPDVVPLPGTTRRDHLEELVGALDLSLSAEDVAFLDAAVPGGTAAGSRYPEDGMDWLDR